MTATLTTHKTISTPVYEAVIRKGPQVLWRKEWRRGTPEFVAYAETQRKFRELAA